MHKLIYEHSKGNRVKTSGFYTVGLTHPEESLWFSTDGNKIKPFGICREECEKYKISYSNHSLIKVRSVKAFKRFIRLHFNEIPSGTKVTLISKWVNCAVSYTKS